MAYISDIECGRCGECGAVSNLKIYCESYGTYYYIDAKFDEERSGEYCKRYRYGTPSVGSAPSSPCYITTIVCDILGLDDECVALQELRVLRDKVMQQNPKYKELLFEYDTVGPKIAKCLREDKDRQDIAMRVYNESIFPTATLVASKEYEKAVAKYSSMTTALKKYYGIEADTKGIESYDYTTGGHGKVKKLGEYPTK